MYKNFLDFIKYSVRMKKIKIFKNLYINNSWLNFKKNINLMNKLWMNSNYKLIDILKKKIAQIIMQWKVLRY